LRGCNFFFKAYLLTRNNSTQSRSKTSTVLFISIARAFECLAAKMAQATLQLPTDIQNQILKLFCYDLYHCLRFVNAHFRLTPKFDLKKKIWPRYEMVCKGWQVSVWSSWRHFKSTHLEEMKIKEPAVPSPLRFLASKPHLIASVQTLHITQVTDMKSEELSKAAELLKVVWQGVSRCSLRRVKVTAGAAAGLFNVLASQPCPNLISLSILKAYDIYSNVNESLLGNLPNLESLAFVYRTPSTNDPDPQASPSLLISIGSKLVKLKHLVISTSPKSTHFLCSSAIYQTIVPLQTIGGR